MSFRAESEPGQLLRVGCVGASVTFGLGLSNRRDESYPAVLERLLAARKKSWRCVVRNFGYSGAAIANQSNQPYAKTSTFHASTRFRPHVVLLMLGTNDAQYANAASRTTLERDLTELVDHYAAPVEGRTATVVVAQPPPAFPPHPEIDFDALERVIRPAIARVAEQQGTPLIDFNTPLLGARNNFPDNLHPNAAAATELAEIACKAIAPLLDAWQGAVVS